LHEANRLLEEGEDVVLKLHTKRSTHREDGDAWRADLLERLPPGDGAHATPAAFAGDPRLGLVGPAGRLQPLSHYWGANEDNVRRLAVQLGIPEPDPDRDHFVAGSMFWLRLEALRPLLDAHLDPQLFEPEAGQVVGTCAHAVERLFGLCVDAAGFRVATAAGACGEPDPPDPAAPYPYARRDG